MPLVRSQQLLRDVLNGRSFVETTPLTHRRAWRKAGRMARALGQWLAGKEYGGPRTLRQMPRVAESDEPGPYPPEEGFSPPEAGRPAPLRPRPGHHLVAARGLPPGDATYLLPKD